MNSDPLEEKWTLLTLEPSLQSPTTGILTQWDELWQSLLLWVGVVAVGVCVAAVCVCVLLLWVCVLGLSAPSCAQGQGFDSHIVLFGLKDVNDIFTWNNSATFCFFSHGVRG